LAREIPNVVGQMVFKQIGFHVWSPLYNHGARLVCMV
jgi:hypothetical protein